MGATACCGVGSALGGPQPVILRIYDAFGNRAVSSFNTLVKAIGTGAFHAGVEVYGQEWSFGFTEQGTGIFSCRPCACCGHRYREAVFMGRTVLDMGEVEELIDSMRSIWIGVEYDLLHRNCCHFSDELCQKLGVGAVPSWVTNLASAGATINKGIKDAAFKARSRAQSAAIIAKAKAGTIDKKYQIRGQVHAKAKDLLAKANHIRMDPRAAAGSVAAAAGDALAKASAVAGKLVAEGGILGSKMQKTSKGLLSADTGLSKS